MQSIIFVGIGGMIGSMLRYVLQLLLRNQTFPYATLLVNLTGSLLIGYIMGWAIRSDLSQHTKLFLTVGFCGGFTTLSAFSWENIQLLEQQRYSSFILYTSITLIGALALTGLGYWISKQTI